MAPPAYRKKIHAELATIWRDYLAAIDRRIWTVLLVAPIALLLWTEFGYPNFFRVYIAPAIPAWRWSEIASSLYWTLSQVFFLIALPVLVGRSVGGIPIRSYGWGLGRWRIGLVAWAVCYLVMLPLVLWASSQPDFQATYPLDPNARLSTELFIVYEISYALFFLGWEFFLRGFMLFGLEKSFGRAAILIQVLPFALLHIGKPSAEAFGSVITGVLLGVLALRTGSFWWGVFIHASVAVTLDLAVMFL